MKWVTDIVDIFSKNRRSEIMSRVKGRGNKLTEIVLLEIFRRHKISGWRRHQPLFGKPDFVFKTSKVAVFVDGCFWHGCPIHASCPTTNVVFWKNKLQRNIIRDDVVNIELKRSGWRVIRLWQHELTKKNENKVAKRILKAIGSIRANAGKRSPSA